MAVNNLPRFSMTKAAVLNKLRGHVVGLCQPRKVHIDDGEALFCARRFLRFLCHAVDHKTAGLMGS